MAENESGKERIDRELIELLNELRVALPGVQVLFAFLLILPFQQRFESINDVERAVFFAALLASAAAAATLIAPSIYHRLNFRRRNKERMLQDANKLLLAGSALTAVGIACSIFLVADLVFGFAVAALATVGTIVVYGGLWALLPLARRRDPDD
jgi:Na+/melibiose symporter-like transporter